MSKKSFDAGDATVTVTADGVQTNITVHVADYAQKYADDKILQYINENIAGKNLSDMELMKKLLHIRPALIMVHRIPDMCL